MEHDVNRVTPRRQRTGDSSGAAADPERNQHGMMENNDFTRYYRD